MPKERSTNTARGPAIVEVANELIRMVTDNSRFDAEKQLDRVVSDTTLGSRRDE